MAKVVFILLLALAYTLGVHSLNHIAMVEEQGVASFYTAASDPQTLLATSPNQ